MPSISLAALDIVGTTVDDHGDVYRALEEAVAETGVPVAPEDLQRWMGADKKEAIGRLLELGGGTNDAPTVRRQFSRFLELLEQRYADRAPVPLPGVEAALERLTERGVHIALTTGFSREVTEPLLTALGWRVGEDGLLDTVVTTDDVAAGRPFPHMIHRAMERLGIGSVQEVLVAGDTLVDVQAGAASGARHVIGVRTGRTPEAAFLDGGATHVLASVAEVPGVLHGDQGLPD